MMSNSIKLVKFLLKWYNDIDKKSIIMISILCFIGISIMFSASPAIASRINISKWHFISKQIFFLTFGFGLMLFISMLKHEIIMRFCYYGFFLMIFLLVITPIIGFSIKGAKRWINLGFFSLQPSEFLKPFFIIISAKLLTLDKGKNLAAIIGISMLLFVVFLCTIQPDFGNAILYILSWGIVAFICGISYDIIIVLGIIFSLTILTGFFRFHHFRDRIILFLNGFSGHEQYQVRKSLESIYNGGYFGTGLGNGNIKYQLPDCHTDYIFSVLSEEMGLIFIMIIIAIYLFLPLRQFLNSKNEKNLLKKNIIYGLSILFAIQSFINIAVNANLIPSKGMSLPFMSYGGSAILTYFISFGIILAFSRKTYSINSVYRFFQ